MIKVGERVRVYDVDNIFNGIVVEIDIDETIRVIRDGCNYNSDDDGWWCHIKQCRKLIKCNKPKFKVGDRVHAVLKDLNIDIKGNIIDIETTHVTREYKVYYYKIDSDVNKDWFPEDFIKRLVKKKVEFKTGDRVRCYKQCGVALLGCGKGTIICQVENTSLDNDNKCFLVKLINNEEGVFNELNIRKLINKKTKLNEKNIDRFKILYGEIHYSDFNDFEKVKYMINFNTKYTMGKDK